MKNKPIYTEIRFNHKTIEDKEEFEEMLDFLLNESEFFARTDLVRACINKSYNDVVSRIQKKHELLVNSKIITGLDGKYLIGNNIRLEDGSIMWGSDNYYMRQILKETTYDIINYEKQGNEWKIRNQYTLDKQQIIKRED